MPRIMTAIVTVAIYNDDETEPVWMGDERIKDLLQDQVMLDIDREAGGDLEDHNIGAVSIDWDTLQLGTIGEAIYRCPQCQDTDTVTIEDLAEIGTPMCGNCDCDKVETVANAVKCYGVDHSKGTIYLPCVFVDRQDGADLNEQIAKAFHKATGESSLEITGHAGWYVDQGGNPWNGTIEESKIE